MQTSNVLDDTEPLSDTVMLPHDAALFAGAAAYFGALRSGMPAPEVSMVGDGTPDILQTTLTEALQQLD